MNRKGKGVGARLPGNTGKKRGDSKGKVGRSISIHGRNVRIFATPLLVVFVFVRSLAYHFFLAIVFIGRCSRRALASRGLLRSEAQNQASDVPGTMSNNRTKSPLGPAEPALALQKKHHRKGFEYISKALKIDEEDGGRLKLTFSFSTIIIIIYSYLFYFYLLLYRSRSI